MLMINSGKKSCISLRVRPYYLTVPIERVKCEKIRTGKLKRRLVLLNFQAYRYARNGTMVYHSPTNTPLIAVTAINHTRSAMHSVTVSIHVLRRVNFSIDMGHNRTHEFKAFEEWLTHKHTYDCILQRSIISLS